MPAFDISDNASRVLYIATVVLNCFLIHLTVYHTKQINGAYRSMIVIFALMGLWFTSLDILVRPLMHSYNSCIMYFTLGGTFRGLKRAAEASLLVYSAMYGILIAFLCIQFIYRACVLARPIWSKIFDGWKLIYWLLYCLIIGGLWSYATFLCSSDTMTNRYMRNEIRSNYGVDIRNVAYFALMGYNYNGTEKTLRWNSVSTFSMFVVILLTQYVICLVCGFIMYRRIEGNASSTSNQYQKLQHQFFKALIYQLAAPCICFHIPSFFFYIAPFFELEISFRSTIIIYGFNVYPLTDSLILLTVISEYKIALKNIARSLLEELASRCTDGTGAQEPSVSIVLSRMSAANGQ